MRGSRRSVSARRAARSRGDARPVLTRAVSRCRSNASPSAGAQLLPQAVLVRQLGDGVEPGLDGGARRPAGRRPIPASSRAPIGVTVRSRTASSEPCAAAVAQGARQLQAAARHLVEEQEAVLPVAAAAG